MLSRNYRSEADIRKRQIDTLKIFNDNVTELKEGSEYKVAFTSGNHELTVSVFLSGDFPNECPQIHISPAIAHPWVTSDGQVTGAPGLLNYTIHSDLGRVVQAIIREFERTPPPLASEVATGSYPPLAASRGTDNDPLGRLSPVTHNYSPNYPQRNFGSPTKTLPLGPAPMYFPELAKLTLEELQFMSDYEDKQDEFLETLQPVKEVNGTLDSLINQIQALTEANLAKRSQLEKKKAEILARIDAVANLRNKCENLNQNYQLLSEKYSPGNIKELLHIEALKIDEESEKIAERFLNGKINLDKFLQLYTEARTLSQVRKTKEEKLAHQLCELKKAGY